MSVYKGFNAASRQRGNCRPHEIVLVLQAGWQILDHAKNDHPGLIARVKKVLNKFDGPWRDACTANPATTAGATYVRCVSR